MSLLRAVRSGRLDRIFASSVLTRAAASSPPSAAEAQAEFWKKNQRLNRPTSPWMIYKFQLTSMLSITHRATGMGLGVLVYGMGVSSLLSSDTNWAQSLEWLAATFPSWSLASVKVLVATSIAYHLLNGIRHLLWDYGYGFHLKQLYASGYLVLVLSLAVGLIAAFNA